jgi:guanylate kinase
MLAIGAAHAHSVTVIGSNADAIACYRAAESESKRPDALVRCSAAIEERQLTDRDRMATFVNRGIVRFRLEDLSGALADFDSALALIAAGAFLEWAEVYGSLYGTPREPVEHALAAGRDVICELDIQGAMSIKRSVPNSVLIFIEPPSFEELTRRLRGRGTEDPEAQGRRIKAAYDEIKQKRIYDHILVNDDMARATDELLRILEEHTRQG